MEKRFEKYKGIHPGIILARELERRSIKQRPFATAIGEHPQTINAITKGRRGITTSMALKIEKQLSIEEGTLLILQAYYDIKIEKGKSQKNMPNLAIFRKSLFWDTDIQKIDWDKQYKAVFARVFERGNSNERDELIRFYGKEKMREALKAPKTKPLSLGPDNP